MAVELSQVLDAAALGLILGEGADVFRATVRVRYRT